MEFDPETGKSKVYDVKTVVEDMPEEEIIEEGEEEIAAVTNETASAEGAEGEEEKEGLTLKLKCKLLRPS